MKLFMMMVCFSVMGFSQHLIPFASQNNTIELSVTNVAALNAGKLSIALVKLPDWLTVSKSSDDMVDLQSGESKHVQFVFSVNKTAPVGKVEKLHVVISSESGEQWTKDIAIQVAAPERYELFQNYPNPFNPATTISYQLPVSSTVSLKVFDILGKEVATLDEGIKEAGYYQQNWNAGGMASGMYLYQLSFQNQQGEMEHYRKKLLLLK
ncbi:MAG: T9SS type A sorting domain-containing protein [Bacteroidota bacterium]